MVHHRFGVGPGVPQLCVDSRPRSIRFAFSILVVQDVIHIEIVVVPKGLLVLGVGGDASLINDHIVGWPPVLAHLIHAKGLMWNWKIILQRRLVPSQLPRHCNIYL